MFYLLATGLPHLGTPELGCPARARWRYVRRVHIATHMGSALPHLKRFAWATYNCARTYVPDDGRETTR